jgi:hypothetical protein
MSFEIFIDHKVYIVIFWVMMPRSVLEEPSASIFRVTISRLQYKIFPIIMKRVCFYHLGLNSCRRTSCEALFIHAG